MKRFIEYIKDDNNTIFEVGDKVLYGKNDGVVTRIDKNRNTIIVVKFFHRWHPALHTDGGRDETKMSYEFDTNNINLKKCRKPKIIISEIDPYGEEDWNENELNENIKYLKYIKENLSDDFYIGDRVEYDTSHNLFADKKYIEKGTVTSKDGFAILVKFDKRWGENLHDGENGIGYDPTERSYWVSYKNSIRLLKKEKIKNKFNHVLDPYGEDDWDE